MSQRNDTERLLSYAAERASEDINYLASVLRKYQAFEGLDDTTLARLLECSPDNLSRVSLCRRPRSDQFRADITKITGHFNLNPHRLVQIIRQVEALEQLQESDLRQRSLMMAARDRANEDAPEQETGSRNQEQQEE